MNDQNSLSELLSAFLDGELEGTEAETLFYMLAGNPDLQTEMRRLIALNTGLRKELLAPPERLFGAIEQRLGFVAAPNSTTAPLAAALPVPAPSPLATFAKSRPFLMLVSAACAIILTLQFAGRPGAEDSAQNTTAASSSVAHQQQALPAEQHLAQPPAANFFATASTQQSYPAYSLTEHKKLQQPAQPLQQEDGAENIDEKDRATTMAILTPVSALMPPVSADNASEINMAEASEEAVPVFSLAAPSSAASDRDFALHLRGFSARSFPALDVDPLAAPTLNNMAIGLSYRLADEHRFGVEIGQENLFQRYYDIQSTTRKTIEQNYLAFWAGATHRYSPALGGFVQPYVQTFLGGTRTGPMMRSTLGAEYQIGAISLAAGVEGMLHLYRYRDAWYSTSKLGFSYSLSFHF